MSDLKLEDHYIVELDTKRELYKYNSCRTENIPLFGHQVLPQGMKYGDPNFSSDGKYLSCIARGKTEDKAFIWSMDNLDSYLFSYTADKIDGLAFAPNGSSFFIIYNGEPPVQYNIKTGKEMCVFNFTGDVISDMIGYVFTPNGKQFGVATKTHFTLWDISNGKLNRNISEKSYVKAMKNDILVSIRDNLEGDIIRFTKGEQLQKFMLPNIKNVNEILASMISPDLNYFYYADKNGIYRCKISLENRRGGFEEMIKFHEEAIKVIISDDCNLGFSTDMYNIFFWKINERDNNNVIFKEKFSSFNVNYDKNLLAVIDDLCINICDTREEPVDQERFIWLDLNPKKFLYFTFSPDFKVLLATLDENNAISYNTETGRVIKKWRNMEDDWSMACEMTPETSQVAVIATKSDPNMIKIWDYNNGSEVLSLPGYHAHSFSFNSEGTILACGARQGDEVARVWDLSSSDYISFVHQGSNNNLYTLVNMTDEDAKKLILCSIDQKPIVFDVATQELLYECECPIMFEKLQKVRSNARYDCFIVMGRDHSKKNMAILYRLSDGKLIQVFENCWNIDLAKNDGVVLSRSTNINGGNLTISQIQDLNNIQDKNCELQAEMSSFLQDDKSIVSAFGDPKNLQFIISDVKSGKMVAELKFTQTYNRHAEVDLSVNKEENVLTLRYLEFVEPIET